MNNKPLLFFSLDAVKFFEKPYFDGKKWYNLSLEQGESFILLSETRSAMLRVPVGENEEPAAYVYSVYGKGDECFIPVYDRTYKVNEEHLYPREIISK